MPAKESSLLVHPEHPQSLFLEQEDGACEAMVVAGGRDSPQASPSRVNITWLSHKSSPETWSLIINDDDGNNITIIFSGRAGTLDFAYERQACYH